MHLLAHFRKSLCAMWDVVWRTPTLHKGKVSQEMIGSCGNGSGNGYKWVEQRYLAGSIGKTWERLDGGSKLREGGGRYIRFGLCNRVPGYSINQSGSVNALQKSLIVHSYYISLYIFTADVFMSVTHVI